MLVYWKAPNAGNLRTVKRGISMKNNQLKTLCECGVLVALALALSYFKIELGANGGSLDFVMVPLLLLAFRNGPLWGVGSGMVFGFLKCVISGSLGWGLPSVLLDYVLAYGMVGFCGFFKRRIAFLEVGTLIACLARYAVHVLSGVVLYAITAPTEIIGRTVASPFVYSLIYNGLYMVPNTVIALCIMALCHAAMGKRLVKDLM